jgi:heterodisulfide reductase subunit A-like polyferredoxin
MVAKSFGGETYSMPKMMKKGNTYFEDDVIGFVFPCYHGSIPTVVEEFLSSSRFNTEYTFAIMTYGNMALGGAKQFIDIAKQNGIKIDYANQIKMADNSLKYYDMEKQIHGLAKKQVNKQIDKIKDDIERKVCNRDCGNVVTSQISKFGYKAYRKEIGDCDKLFEIEDHCTLCKVCEMVCPVDNIKVDGKVNFKGQCIRCYACTQNCPSNAIRFKGEKSKTRYRNPDISLKEIILANS